MKFTNAPVAWTPDTVCDSDKFNREIKEKMDDIEKGLSSKLITATRVMTAITGNVAYTGVGFMPTSIICFANINSTIPASWGVSDSAKAVGSIVIYLADNMQSASVFIYVTSSSGNYQTAVIASYDADGFTLTWTRTGSPTGTASLKFLCFR